MPNAEWPESDWVDLAREWLATYGDPEDLRRISESWNNFAPSRPVVTLFGAYDTGKSALLRRLLVDSGLHVPEWLTISARHETFEASDILFHEIALRDTPGISAEATDARGVANTEAALGATGLTDILLVVVPPQGPTGELEVIRDLLNKPWREGSLWFAISRFDEAGIDPIGDPEGYRRLAEAKTAELRRSLGLTAGTCTFVVAPDPYQLGGDVREPDQNTWDDCREWDGIGDLAQALRSVASEARALRGAAEIRYWEQAIEHHVQALERNAPEASSATRTADQERRRIDQLSARLEELRTTAKNDLERVVGEVVDQSWTSTLETKELLENRTIHALNAWHDKHKAALEALIRDAEVQLAAQLDRASWQDIESLIQSLRPAPDDTFSETQGEPDGAARRLQPRLLELNKDLARTLTNLKQIFTTTTSDFARASRGPATEVGTTAAAQTTGTKLGSSTKLFALGDVVTTVAPFALQAFTLIDDYRRENAQRAEEARRLDRIDKKLRSLRETVVNRAFATFQRAADSIDQTLGEMGSAIDALRSTLAARASLVAAAREDAETLTSKARALVNGDLS